MIIISAHLNPIMHEVGYINLGNKKVTITQTHNSLTCKCNKLREHPIKSPQTTLVGIQTPHQLAPT